MAAQRILDLKGIAHELLFLDHCSIISAARNTLVAMFMLDPEATDLLFIDSDVSFDPEAVVKLLQCSEDVVGGVYPLKRDDGGFPAKLRLVDGKHVEKDGLLEGELLPGGFLRIKRTVFEQMQEAHPELKYDDGVLSAKGFPVRGGYDLFGMGVYGRQLRGEDFAFCQRWRDMGGTVWVYPDINFEHLGVKAFPGNFHDYMLSLPGGRIANAMNIKGWMTPKELEWLGRRAMEHNAIAEIGCFMGRSTRALADNTPGTVHAIDPWDGSGEVAALYGPLNAERMYRTFCENLAGCKVFACKGRSLDVAAQMNGQRFDMVFIDGAHDYENVKADIVAWSKRLTPGGLLCGHDYTMTGVRRAVDELLPHATKIPETDIWACVPGEAK